MKRLSWSKLFNLTALLSFGLATAIASAATAGASNTVTPRVPSSDPSTGAVKAWEGFLTTAGSGATNYLNASSNGALSTAAIAVGPQNVITVQNDRVAMYDNPNTLLPVLNGTGNTATVTNQFVHSVPGATNISGGAGNPGLVATAANFPPTSEASLFTMLGTTAITELCPTVPRNPAISCVLQHSTVRYDQMHGRFIIAFTVTDTGIPSAGSPPSSPRKASWVIMISRIALFPANGTPGSSDIFVCPNPAAADCSRPGVLLTSQPGSINVNNWAMYYGGTAIGGVYDGFGDSNLGGEGGGPGNGSLNTIGDTTAAQPPFDCSVAAMNTTTTVCYFPTDLRIGIDNDNIILTSPVVNTNLPAGTNRFGGTRVRVIKKGGGLVTAAGLYQKSLATTNVALSGAAWTTTAAGADLLDFYDVFATKTNGATPPAPVPFDPADFAAPYGYAPYTVAPMDSATVTNFGLGAAQGIFCEPARVRGRPEASYTNPMTPLNLPAPYKNPLSQNYLACTIAGVQNAAVVPGTYRNIYLQPIVYFVVQNPFQNVFPNPVNQNRFLTYIALPIGQLQNVIGAATLADMYPIDTGADIRDPHAVQQLGNTSTGAAAAQVLYVGDNRPQELVMREGYLYDARAQFTGASIVDGTTPSSQSVGDILQVLHVNGFTYMHNDVSGVPGGVPFGFFNTNTYAPMFEVPADVTTRGVGNSALGSVAWTEKLFAATTILPLASSDPRAQASGNVNAGEQNGIADCTGYELYPNTVGGQPDQSPTGSTVHPLAFAGLFNMRCGTDIYDTLQNMVNPITGGLTPVYAPNVRGSAAIDPNDGSQWNFGLYASRRFSSPAGFGQTGSYIANYAMNIASANFSPLNIYGDNSQVVINDCNSPSNCSSPAFYAPVQIAVSQGLALLDANGNVGVNQGVLRQEMARYTALAMMDEEAITQFLGSSGGCTTSFADVASDCAAGGVVPSKATPSSSYWRYIETLYRKHVTNGCGGTNDVTRMFCPTASLTREQMAVFLVRAKMSNVYPSVISGCVSNTSCLGVVGGDNFNNSLTAYPNFFSDVNPASPYLPFIQQMYIMRITTGVAGAGQPPAYNPSGTLTRGQLLTMLARAFFY